MGPLNGTRVVEVSGIGPGPFCGMMLSDMGAEVITVVRSAEEIQTASPHNRNRCVIALDLKSQPGLDALLTLIDKSDVLFEGFRPGVAERLGFGPDSCLERNPRLVYGRMTGWGQNGPLSHAAGHDLNYIALSGALKAIGRKGEKPVPPLNLVGDFGGGGMFLAFGIVCALFESRLSGKGQVIDAAMVDGAITLMSSFIPPASFSPSCDQTGAHFLSGAAHCYDTYETSDGQFIAIAAIESQFYGLLIEKLGLDQELFGQHTLIDNPDPDQWTQLKQILSDIFKTKSRAEWCGLLEGTDVCFAPVLSISEAPEHPHNRARGNFVKVGNSLQNAPAPRFSRTSARSPQPPRHSRRDMESVLQGWDYDSEAIQRIVGSAHWA